MCIYKCKVKVHAHVTTHFILLLSSHHDNDIKNLLRFNEYFSLVFVVAYD